MVVALSLEDGGGGLVGFCSRDRPLCCGTSSAHYSTQHERPGLGPRTAHRTEYGARVITRSSH